MLILKLYGLFLLKCLDTMWLSRNETTKRRMRWALGVTTIVQNSSQMGLNYQLPPNKKGQIPSKLTCWPIPASSLAGTHWSRNFFKRYSPYFSALDYCKTIVWNIKFDDENIRGPKYTLCGFYPKLKHF